MGLSDIGAIGFDWDGTLVDSMIVKAKAFAESLIRFFPNIENKRRDLEGFLFDKAGKHRKMLMRILSENLGIELLSGRRFREWSDLYNSLFMEKGTPLFEGVTDTLSGLKERGYKMFVSSSVPQGRLESLVKRYPLGGFFEFVLGTRGDFEFIKGLPHLEFASERLGIGLGRIAFVGDSRHDIEVAKGAGVFSIGKVNGGIPGSREAIEGAGPDLVIEELRELLGHFK